MSGIVWAGRAPRPRVRGERLTVMSAAVVAFYRWRHAHLPFRWRYVDDWSRTVRSGWHWRGRNFRTRQEG